MLTIWVIYDHPWDFPNNWVVRAHVVTAKGNEPQNACVVCGSLDEARSAIPYGLVCVPRTTEDDTKIYETWM